MPRGLILVGLVLDCFLQRGHFFEHRFTGYPTVRRDTWARRLERNVRPAGPGVGIGIDTIRRIEQLVSRGTVHVLKSWRASARRAGRAGGANARGAL